MSQSASRNALAEAVLAVLNGPDGLGGMEKPRTAYERDDAPTKGGDYVTITLTRVAGGNQRIGDHLAPSRWELMTEAVGSVSNVGALLDRCTAALEHTSIAVGDETSTGIRFISESDIDQKYDDQALYAGDRDWSFAF